MIEETKSNWDCVTKELMQEVNPISLGQYASYWMQNTPRRMLHCMSYYKFAAKLIGKNKKVLDVGCNEGLGTYLIAKECGFAKGLDIDGKAIDVAKNNFPEEIVDFECSDILNISPEPKWDAVVNFDVIEHIFPENEKVFFESLTSQLTPEGLAVIGTPSLISQDFTSEVSKKGHVNIYNYQQLEAIMKKHFHFTFLFAANDEVVHTGFMPLAHYFIAVGCKKK